jgi:hypothetical protein
MHDPAASPQILPVKRLGNPFHYEVADCVGMPQSLALDDLNFALSGGGTDNLLDMNFVHHLSVMSPG